MEQIPIQNDIIQYFSLFFEEEIMVLNICQRTNWAADYSPVKHLVLWSTITFVGAVALVQNYCAAWANWTVKNSNKLFSYLFHWEMWLLQKLFLKFGWDPLCKHSSLGWELPLVHIEHCFRQIKAKSCWEPNCFQTGKKLFCSVLLIPSHDILGFPRMWWMWCS